jgi:hypothetical protein
MRNGGGEPVSDTSVGPFLNIFDPGFHYEQPEIVQAREQSWYAAVAVCLCFSTGACANVTTAR